MEKRLIQVVLILGLCLPFVLGCGGGGTSNNNEDTRPPPAVRDAAIPPSADAEVVVPVDAGAVTGEVGQSTGVGCADNDSIINPPDNRGGGSIITRQLPVAYQTCKAQ